MTSSIPSSIVPVGTTNFVSNIRAMFKAQKPDPETGMLEIINASFIADEDAIYGTVNHEWNKRELEWYLSQSLEVCHIPPPIPKVWQDVASKDGFINSNYGWAVFSKENGEQFKMAAAQLKSSKHTRQATMIYNRPTMHIDAYRNGMRDFMCTYAQQYVIRNNKLHLMVFMRSNDAVFGYKGDRAWAEYLLDGMLSEIGSTYPDVTKGDIIWNAASLHIYPRHHHLVHSEQ